MFESERSAIFHGRWVHRGAWCHHESTPLNRTFQTMHCTALTFRLGVWCQYKMIRGVQLASYHKRTEPSSLAMVWNKGTGNRTSHPGTLAITRKMVFIQYRTFESPCANPYSLARTIWQILHRIRYFTTPFQYHVGVNPLPQSGWASSTTNGSRASIGFGFSSLEILVLSMRRR